VFEFEIAEMNKHYDSIHKLTFTMDFAFTSCKYPRSKEVGQKRVHSLTGNSAVVDVPYHMVSTLTVRALPWST